MEGQDALLVLLDTACLSDEGERDQHDRDPARVDSGATARIHPGITESTPSITNRPQAMPTDFDQDVLWKFERTETTATASGKTATMS